MYAIDQTSKQVSGETYVPAIRYYSSYSTLVHHYIHAPLTSND